MKHHIFLSYSRKDLDLMRRLRADLESLGFTVWTDEGIDPGTPLWDEAIENALKNTGCMVVILTPNAIDARGLRREIHFAEIHEVHIIPVLAEGTAKTSVPYSLSGIQWTDIRSDYNAGLTQLQNAVKKYLNDAAPTVNLTPKISSQQASPEIPLWLQYEIKSKGESPGTEPVNLGWEWFLGTATEDQREVPSLTSENPKPPQINLPDLPKILPPPFDWCSIPAGKVTLEKGGYLKEPTTFHISPFAIAKYPITNAQFAKFIDAGGYENRNWWANAGWHLRQEKGWIQPGYWTDKKWNGADYPVVGVSWYEALAFCNWLNSLPMYGEGTKGRGLITLPTEQQWQRAAQGDDGRAYPWGNDFAKSRCNTSESGIGKTTPVTQYPNSVSPFGVMDLSGNVWEWCLTSPKNGSQDTKGTNLRLLRGGSWDYILLNARVASRNDFPPNNRNYSCGFRVVAVPQL